MKVEITTLDYYINEHGEKVITETVHEEDIPNPDNRHDVLCARCGWSTYPECRKNCQGESWWRKDHPKEAAEFKK